MSWAEGDEMRVEKGKEKESLVEGRSPTCSESGGRDAVMRGRTRENVMRGRKRPGSLALTDE